MVSSVPVVASSVPVVATSVPVVVNTLPVVADSAPVEVGTYLLWLTLLLWFDTVPAMVNIVPAVVSELCLTLFLLLFTRHLYWLILRLLYLSPRAHLHVVGMLRFISKTYSNRACPLLFILLASVSPFLWPFQLYFIPLNSPDNCSLSHSVLRVLFLPYWSFELYLSLRKSPSALI